VGCRLSVGDENTRRQRYGSPPLECGRVMHGGVQHCGAGRGRRQLRRYQRKGTIVGGLGWAGPDKTGCMKDWVEWILGFRIDFEFYSRFLIQNKEV
jgi:hypothetical protein